MGVSNVLYFQMSGLDNKVKVEVCCNLTSCQTGWIWSELSPHLYHHLVWPNNISRKYVGLHQVTVCVEGATVQIAT